MIEKYLSPGNKVEIQFMQGCGNDYVYVNGMQEMIPMEMKPEIVRFLSDRHFGIGGDGVIFINGASEADFEMEMYNADGTRSEMCGNGIRCVGKFVYDKGLTREKQITVVSAGKIKYLDLQVGESGQVEMVKVNMGSPILVPEQIPAKFHGEQAVNAPIIVQGEEYRVTCVSMGNPHAVVFVNQTGEMDLEEIGPSFENHEVFPNRTNTEFVEVVDRKHVKMRVWERGSGETLACGTGCCATVVAAVLNGLTDTEVEVEVLGGKIQIFWDRDENVVYMTGPATTVFEGEINI